MATDPDVLQLAALLDGEGYGALAGELLTELNLGREVEGFVDRGSDGRPQDLRETEIKREPYPEDEHFAFAISFLRDRLVTSARMLAEAERIAGTLEKAGGAPVLITFADEEGEGGDHVTRVAGDEHLAVKLEALLDRLPSLRDTSGQTT